MALPPLQNPLQRIISDPPARVKLGYKAIGRVRWVFGAVLIVSMRPRCLRPLAHRFSGGHFKLARVAVIIALNALCSGVTSNLVGIDAFRHFRKPLSFQSGNEKEICRNDA
jgi:hypothetical protein